MAAERNFDKNMTKPTNTGIAIADNNFGAAISFSTVSFALIVADAKTLGQTYTIAKTSNEGAPATDVLFANATDLSGGGDALPSLADASAYDRWLTNNVTLFSQAGIPDEPGNSVGLSMAGRFSSSNDETVNGSHIDDVLFGSAGNDTLQGNGGFDVLQGGDGADILNGGSDFDIANYHFEGGTDGVTASLVVNSATDSYGNRDTLISIEGFWGTNSADTFSGNSGDNLFTGNAGADLFFGLGGFDVVDYSNEIGGSGIRMESNFFTPSFSVVDTFGYLDTGSSIEAIYATQYDDILRAQDHDTYYDALGGDDQIYAYTGNDTLIGGDGFDTLSGGAGDDVIDGGGTGAEDELHYGSFLVDSVIVDMMNGVATSSAGDVDQFVNIFRVVGSHGGDLLIGNNEANEFVGGSASDTIDGGGGVDRVRYDLETGIGNYGINANLRTGVVQAGYLGMDTLRDIEWIVGSIRDDTISGNADSNILEGYLGNDVMDGRGGIDTLSFFVSGFRVSVDLAVTTRQYTIGAGFDTITNFENILGSRFDDTFFGDRRDNVIEGGAGADIIDGRGNGASGDTASYEQSGARVIVDLTAGTASGGDATGDTLSNIENLTGSAHNDHLTGSRIGNSLFGGSGKDVLKGLRGNDVLEGGDDQDRLFGGAGDDALIGGLGQDTLNGGSNNDTLIGGVGHDRLDGGNGRDRLIGENGNDDLFGRQGADEINGNRGFDDLRGGSGDDTLRGGSGNDTITGGLGQDLLVGNSGEDIFVFTDLGESTNDTSRDEIQDFELGDQIDLSEVFEGELTFIGNAEFSGTTLGASGELRVRDDGNGDSTIFIDTDGDGSADMRIFVLGYNSLVESDFML